MVIGDFGCGRTRLAELLNNKVYNFEHHNILAKKVIACDMKRTLLKKETGRRCRSIFTIANGSKLDRIYCRSRDVLGREGC
jgi:hypothetical protein